MCDLPRRCADCRLSDRQCAITNDQAFNLSVVLLLAASASALFCMFGTLPRMLGQEVETEARFSDEDNGVSRLPNQGASGSH